jgi:Flp pilus assembly protein TadD
LLTARTAARSDHEKLAIDLALARTYSHLERWPQLEEVSTRLAQAWPMSGHAFHYQQWARIQQKRWNEVSVAAQERLAKYPNDVSALRTQVESADLRGSFTDMATHMRPLIEGARATPSEYNEFAWMSLLQQPVSEQAVEAARQAFDDTQGRDPAIAHTLACVYAATGRPREARDLLLKNAMRPGSDELDDSMWFGFGMVAEAYGDSESAREYYSHVEKPKQAMIPSTSVYAMAQQRMKRL